MYNNYKHKKMILEKMIFGVFCLLSFSFLPGGFQKTEAMASDSIVHYAPRMISKGLNATPIWEQHTIWSKKSSAARHGCGICTTAMVLNLNGVATTPNIVLKENKRKINKCKAFKPKEILPYIRSKGIAAFNFNTRKLSRKQSVNIMNTALRNGKTVMLMTCGYPFSSNYHWVLLTGFNKSGRIVVANSSYGGRNVCKIRKKQYQLVTWKQISKTIVRDSKRWSSFIVIGN